MNALVIVLVELFGPVLSRALERLLDDLLWRAREKLRAQAVEPTDDTASDIELLFRTARRQLWWWQFAKKRLLEVCEPLAIERADDVAVAVAGGPQPRLTLDQADRLVSAKLTT